MVTLGLLWFALAPGIPVYKGILDLQYPAIAVELNPNFWVALDTRRGGLLRMWRGNLEASKDASGKSQLTSKGDTVLEATEKESIWAMRSNGSGESLSPLILRIAVQPGRLSILYQADAKKRSFKIHEVIQTRLKDGNVTEFDRLIETNPFPHETYLYFIAPPGDCTLSGMFWEDYTESLHLVGKSDWRGRASYVIDDQMAGFYRRRRHQG